MASKSQFDNGIINEIINEKQLKREKQYKDIDDALNNMLLYISKDEDERESVKADLFKEKISSLNCNVKGHEK